MLRPPIEFLYPVAALICAAAGAAYDVSSRRVPNRLTLPGVVLGLVLHGVLAGWGQATAAALGALLGGFVFLVFYLAGGMGAGDVKLIAAVGAMVGVAHITPVLVFTGLAGGVMAIVLALWRGKLAVTLKNMRALLSHHWSRGLAAHPDINVRNEHMLRLPYAVAIAVGCALDLFLQVVER